jgi:cellulose synthase/poly-beta-1,6-N-acetylglucosamine synthase-like glycosyltransferase
MATNFYIAGTTVMEAFMSILPCREARQAVSRLAANNFEFPTPDEELPIIDFLIVAYLPNEKDIIMDQALYALNKIIYPKDKIRINILYNTPKPIEPLQTELQALTKEYSHCRVISVPNSTSKADNLNYFFTLDTGSDVIAIYDCDHFPHPYSPRWAAERFCQDKNVKIVQGRCIVYNSNESLLTQLVTVEFDKIYAVSHPGRAVMMGFALFCGSNGYWKADLIKKLRMDESMLTEDIDSALRAFTVGAKCVHELNVVSYEQAPR